MGLTESLEKTAETTVLDPSPKRPMIKMQAFEIVNMKDLSALVVSKVNALIDDYNLAEDPLIKKSILRTIQQKIRVVDHNCPNSQIEQSPDYREARAALFIEIKYQLETLGERSLLYENNDATSFEELIANMSPEKIDKLLAILSKGNRPELEEELKALYETDDNSQEAADFRMFLTSYEIRYLGGMNSQNYKVTNLYTKQDMVLKVDNRLNTPRNIEDHLRETLRNFISPIHVEREGTYTDDSGKVTSRTILVTSYYKSGSLEQECKDFIDRNKKRPIDELVIHECSIFEKMAKILSDIQDAGCIFPDAKLSNWLIDESGNVFISDTKSMGYTNDQGVFTLDQPGNEFAHLLYTPGYVPPEFQDVSLDIKSHSTHAFILGKNLYKYATGKAGEDGKELDFGHVIFSDTKGQELKTLIQALVNPDPDKRMSIRNAQIELYMISNSECRQVFADLDALRIGPNDKKMDTFIRRKLKQIREGTPEEKDRIVQELKRMVIDLKSDKAVKDVQDIISHYREHAGLLTVGMREKADNIEASLAHVPIEQRTNLLDSKEAEAVVKEITAHRLRRKVLHRGHDPEKAAQLFAELKARHSEKLSKDPEPPSSTKLDT